MTPAEHIARAEALLAGVVAETRMEFIALAIGHAVVGWVRHETGLWEDE